MNADPDRPLDVDPATRARINAFYRETLQRGGPSPAGVDFNSSYAQEERFRQLLRVVDVTRFSLLDYGCGYGALYPYLCATNSGIERYQGYDITDTMVALAGQRWADARASFTSARAALEPSDYVVASGLFNIRFMESTAAWGEHIERTIDDLAALAVRGFAFNMLTIHSDPERMRPDLYYGDPTNYFAYCRRFSRHVALLHDYPLFDFTIVVRKQLPAPLPSP